MAIIWPWPWSAASYAAAGQQIVVPPQRCPGCQRPLVGWGGYWRWLRAPPAGEQRVWIRRGRCPACQRTHALLPDLVLVRRLDAVAVIGRELALLAGVLAGATRTFSYGEPQLVEAAVVVAAHRHLPGTVRASWHGPELDLEALASQDPLALARFGVEAVLRTSIERYYANGADGRAKAYLGEQIADFLPPGWRGPQRPLPSAASAAPEGTPGAVCRRDGCGHGSARHYPGDGGRGHDGTGCRRRGCACGTLLLDDGAEHSVGAEG